MTRSIQADLFAVRDAVVAGRTAFGIPPSDLDDEPDEMRVDVGGIVVVRAYDPDLEQP